jgi:hypothetical protein
LFENKYPKTTGHVELGTTGDLTGFLSGTFSNTDTPEYIRVWGGLHTGSVSDALDYQLSNSAKYDEDTNRNQNWDFDLSSGTTIEFWMKKAPYDAINEPVEVILDLWNGETVDSSEECRLVLSTGEFTGSPLMFFTLKSNGVVQTAQFEIPKPHSWNHYALSFHNTPTDTMVSIFVNGEEIGPTVSIGALIPSFSGRINGFIGALQGEKKPVPVLGEQFQQWFKGVG